jgi:signal transduction histidine kinase
MLAMALFCARHPSVPGALSFMIAVLFAAAWAAGSVMEYAAVDLATKIFWIKFQTACQLPAVTTATFFVLEYSWPGRWLNRRNSALLSIAPVLVVLLILSDDLLHFIWRSFKFDGSVVTPLLGLGGWMAIAYSFGLVILSFIVLTWLFLHSPQHRWPVMIMVAGHIGARTMYVLEKANLVSATLPLDVLGLAFMVIMYAIALFGFRMFDPIPLARQMVIDQMREGMLVVDSAGKVVSLNRAAAAILGIPDKQVCGRPLPEVLPFCPPLSEGGLSEAEIRLETGSGARTYLLSTSSLKDWRGMDAGSLLLLHDITIRKQAEAALNRSQEIQRLIYEKSFDGISIYEEIPDLDKRILVDCNERYCLIAGRSKEELLAIQDTRLIQQSEQFTEDSDRAAVLTEQAFSGAFSWIRPDGKENIIEYNAAPIRVWDRFYTIGVDRDVTESRHAHAQILQQQRALAMLQERTRLARELHDSIGQVLAYVSMQAQAIRKRAREGDLPAVDAQLSRLAEASQVAHADLRESILSLNIGAGEDWSFPTALRQYLDAYRDNYGIQTHLTLPDGCCDGCFEPEAEVQLLRVIQEAMNNSRKHAQAARVEVCFLEQEDGIRVLIADDGRGFDAELLKEGEPGHYGLRFMQERAESLGGTLKVESSPGRGTCIILEVQRG